ncbi:MAG: MFS transporter [Deinococcales bacterium]
MQIFAALEVAAYRNFWVAQLFSLIGSWLQASAIGWLVVTLLYPNQPALATAQLGILSAIQWTPSLFLSLFAGALLDRFSRKKALFASQTMLMCVAISFSLVVYFKIASFPLVAMLAFCAGIANVFDIVARQSLVPTLVPKPLMPNAIALNALAFNSTRIFGGALFGLVAPLGLASIFVLNALSFLGVLYAIWYIEIPMPAPRKSSNILEDVKTGLVYVFQNKKVGVPILLLMCLSLTVINFQVIIPTFARFALGLNEDGFGLLSAAFGVGAAIGAVIQAIKTDDKRGLMRWGGVQLSGSMLLFSFVPNLTWACLVLVLAGTGMILVTVSVNSTVQVSTPDELRARVMSVFSLVFAGMSPPGALLSGWLMSGFGARGGVVVLGALGLLAVLALGRAIASD